MASALIGIRLAIFGFYTGASYAPTHKGMPVLHANSRLEYSAKHQIPCTGAALLQSCGVIVRYLNDVGLAAGRRFQCPWAAVSGRC